MEEATPTEVLAQVSRFDQELAQVETPREAVDLADKAKAIHDYLKKAGADFPQLNELLLRRVKALHKGGILLPPEEQMAEAGVNQWSSDAGRPTTWRDLDLARQDGNRLRLLAKLDEADLNDWYQEILEKQAKAEVRKPEPTLSRALQYAAKLFNPAEVLIDPPQGTYSSIVIDPPWPIAKIGRDEREMQGAFDYHVETLDELEVLIGELLDPIVPDDAHLYLWTTHKHLPAAISLAGTWGFKYQCLLTWVKNVGITPFSWMYSTEHVLFARKGNLDLLVKGKRLDFTGKVREHSRKPDEFYDLIREVSPGPRLDMFSREAREGFETWGHEKGKFSATG